MDDAEMTRRGADDPNANLDEWIEAYFADQKILSKDVARRLVDRQPIHRTPLPDYDRRLFDWLTEMLITVCRTAWNERGRSFSN